MGKEAVGNVSAGKRRILIPFVAGLLVVAGVGVPIDTPAIAAGDPDDCTGDAVVAPTQVDGVYQITTAGELKHVANTDALWSEDFLVMNDISLAGCGDWDPIGVDPDGGTAFTGEFNGGGHSISGLVINLPAVQDVGLFGFSSGASFTGVNLVDVDVEGDTQVGALVGQFVGTDASHEITDSSVTGKVVGGDNDIGGLVGLFNSPGAVVDNSWSDSTVEGLSDVGGLVGEVDNGSITNSWAKGQVVGDDQDDQIGGLVGDFRSIDSDNKGSITNSWASATVEGGDDVGGLVGDFDKSGNIEDSYALGDVTAVDGAGGLVGHFDDSGDIKDSYATGNVEATKDKIGGLVGDFHDSDEIFNSYAEGTVSGRERVGGLVGHFEDAGGTAKIEDSHATGAVTARTIRVGGLVGYFEDAGEIANAYATGAVSGGEEEISGILAGDAGGLVGLFDSSSGQVRGSYATGNVAATGNRVGGLMGWLTDGVINDNSYATGTVTGASRQIGGLIGRHDGGQISAVHATGNVIATGEEQAARDVGGLVGAAAAGIEIAQSYATGSVTVTNSIDGRIGGLVGGLQSAQTVLKSSFATGTVAGADYTGGLVGRVYNGGKVESSYASNSVQGADNVGGLVGGLDAGADEIVNSYASGSATGENKVGGLVGFMDGAAVSLTTSYSTAQATGDSNVGGLVGEATNDATADRSFWDLQTSGLTTSVLGAGKDTAAMKTIGTYTSVDPSWDIVAATAFGQPDSDSDEVWGIGAGVNCGYPFLYWQDGAGHSCPVSEAGSVREKRADSPAIAMDLQASVGQQVTGAPVVIGGEGLAADARYTLIVRSTPTIVDSGSATALGNFSARVTLPNLPPGNHTLTLSATAPDGTPLTLVQTVTVSSAGTFSAMGDTSGTHTGGLAATGVPDQSLALGLSGFAVLAGLLLLAASRRRLVGE